VPQGFGALLAKLAAGIPVELSNPVTRISWGARGVVVDVDTMRGQFEARAAIVTVSTNVLAAGKIKFTPDLPKRQLDAARQAQARQLRSCGAGIARQSVRVAARRAGVREIRRQPHGGAIRQCVRHVALHRRGGGHFGRDLSAKGDAAMFDLRSPGSPACSGPMWARRSSAGTRPTGTTSLGDGRVLGRGARRPAVPQGADGIPKRPRLVRGRSRHETLWGTSEAPGNPASAPPTRCLKSFGRKTG